MTNTAVIRNSTMPVELRTIVRTYTQDMERISTAEAAKRGGVGVETIRYYERHGLMPKAPRTHSGYRVFTEDAVMRLRFIKRAQEVGVLAEGDQRSLGTARETGVVLCRRPAQGRGQDHRSGREDSTS
jgi:hypothetical protein